MFRKKRSEKLQEKIEAAERRRRLHEALSNPKVTLADSEAVEAVADYQHAARDVERVGALPDPVPERAVCEKHPEWHPVRRFATEPPPPASQCPFCLEEFDRRPVSQPVYLDGGSPSNPLPPKLEALLERKNAERLANGEILPDSPEEAHALAQIDARRGDRHSRDRVITSGMIVDGKFTTYRVPAPKRRRAPRGWYEDGDRIFVSQQCSYLRPNGTQCRSWAVPGSDVCHFHSLTEEERAEMARAGGRARVRKVHQRKALEAVRNAGPRVERSAHEQALSELQAARARLLELYREGRISAEELPPGVLGLSVAAEA